jgi:hypothetical protein
MSSRLARLQGHLRVLLAVQEELHAIGASGARRRKNRDAIARLRAELGKNGDLTDATRGARS